MAIKQSALPLAYRLAVAARIAAAALGGYLLAALSSVMLAWVLPLPRPEAVVVSMMLAFIVYLLAVLWCFACSSTRRAWLGLLVPSLLLAAIDGGLYWINQP
jgi:hypothetical protein